MTLEKPRDQKERPKAIYVALRDHSGERIRTRTFSVYGATIEQVEKRLKRAVAASRREPTAANV